MNISPEDIAHIKAEVIKELKNDIKLKIDMDGRSINVSVFVGDDEIASDSIVSSHIRELMTP